MCILPLICALGIQIAVSVAGMIVYTVAFIISMASQGKSMNEAMAKAAEIPPDLSTILSLLAALICMIVFYFWYRGLTRGTDALKIKGVFTAKSVGCIAVLGFGLQAAVSWMLTAISNAMPEWFESYNELMEAITGGNTVLMIVFICVIAPVSEEVIFRGVVLRKASKILPLASANIFQAALFGIYHMNIIQGLYAFVLGLFLGLVCIRYRSIYGAILLHMVFNSSNIILNGILSTVPESVTGTISTVLFVISAAVIFGVSRGLIKGMDNSPAV